MFISVKPVEYIIYGTLNENSSEIQGSEIAFLITITLDCSRCINTGVNYCVFKNNLKLATPFSRFLTVQKCSSNVIHENFAKASE